MIKPKYQIILLICFSISCNKVPDKNENINQPNNSETLSEKNLKVKAEKTEIDIEIENGFSKLITEDFLSDKLLIGKPSKLKKFKSLNFST